MKKLLLVEDDVTIATIYQNKFRVEDFTVEIARDGKAGFEMAHSFRPDIVVLDLMLPKMTGVELMQKLRAEPDFKELPFIVLSNTYMSSMVQEAWKAGATKCLSKTNCTPKQVIEIVLEVLEGKKPATEVALTVANDSTSAVERTEDEADANFQAALRKTFLASLPPTLSSLRGLLSNLVRASGESARLEQIQELYSRIHTLTGNAGITGMTRIAQMSNAFEALLRELQDAPKNINDSTLRTTAMIIDFLGVLFEKSTGEDTDESQNASILVVDDETISRRAITYALDKAGLKSTPIEDSLNALELIKQKKFDLIFLDVDMPNMTGFELCSKIRELPAYLKTPVIFVTSLNDFKSRASSSMSGGNDFIGKPFLYIELAAKALVHVLRGKLETKR